MQIFVCDPLHYRVHLDKLETGSALPYPLGKAHLDAGAAVKIYAEHLDRGRNSTGAATTAWASTSITYRQQKKSQPSGMFFYALPLPAADTTHSAGNNRPGH